MPPGQFATLTLICCLIGAATHFLSRRLGWTTPRRLGRKKFPIPPTSEGAFAFLLGFLLCLAAGFGRFQPDFLLSDSEMVARHFALALSLVWIWVAGRLADARGASHFVITAILAGGALILAWGGFQIPAIRVGETVYNLGWFALVGTLIWLVVMAEFFRLFEGLDGVLVTLLIAAFGLQYFNLPAEETYARLLCLCVLIPLVGLLPWRIYPARIELRGIGAYLPGFVFGAITVVGREKAFTAKAVLLPVFVLIVVLSLLALWLLEQHLFLPKGKRK